MRGSCASTNLSSSGEPKARPGDPVITGIWGDYWVARSSRAMTDGGAFPGQAFAMSPLTSDRSSISSARRLTNTTSRCRAGVARMKRRRNPGGQPPFPALLFASCGLPCFVMPAKAGIQWEHSGGSAVVLDPSLRWGDGGGRARSWSHSVDARVRTPACAGVTGGRARPAPWMLGSSPSTSRWGCMVSVKRSPRLTRSRGCSGQAQTPQAVIFRRADGGTGGPNRLRLLR